jgi:hypothetical protein
MDKVEALIDAVGALNGIGNPDSVAYALRNPLLVRSFAKPGQHEIDDDGRRRFTTLQSGYKAGYFDVELKITGKSRSRVDADSTLTMLLATYGLKELLAIDKVVRFLKRALKDETISRTTPLRYFHNQITEK